jgi:hypothetical protein
MNALISSVKSILFADLGHGFFRNVWYPQAMHVYGLMYRTSDIIYIDIYKTYVVYRCWAREVKPPQKIGSKTFFGGVGQKKTNFKLIYEILTLVMVLTWEKMIFFGREFLRVFTTF